MIANQDLIDRRRKPYKTKYILSEGLVNEIALDGKVLMGQNLDSLFAKERLLHSFSVPAISRLTKFISGIKD